MSESEVHFIDTSRFVKAMERVAVAAHQVEVALLITSRRQAAHKRRCHRCSPISNPRPLAIDGMAYRRRTRSRRGKR